VFASALRVSALAFNHYSTGVIPMSSVERVYSYSAVLMGSPILLKLFEDNQQAARAVFHLIKQQEDMLTVNRGNCSARWY
jgi:thiamine biosynthesis lipoprotein